MNMRRLILLALLTVTAVAARALRYETARTEALFLSDKMAYELNLSASQYEAVYEINFDYFLSVTTSYDLYSDLWKRRNFELQHVLTPYQYETFLRLKYFYRPLGWTDGRWEFRVYRTYPNRSHFMMSRPRAYSSYRGGSHFGTRPAGSPPPHARPGNRPGSMGPGQSVHRHSGTPPQGQQGQQRPPQGQQGQQRPPQGQQGQRPPQGQQGQQRPPQGQQGQRPPQGQQGQQRPQRTLGGSHR